MITKERLRDLAVWSDKERCFDKKPTKQSAQIDAYNLKYRGSILPKKMGKKDANGNWIIVRRSLVSYENVFQRQNNTVRGEEMSEKERKIYDLIQKLKDISINIQATDRMIDRLPGRFSPQDQELSQPSGMHTGNPRR